jgi:multiple sugar transport system substrate-binding protein
MVTQQTSDVWNAVDGGMHGFHPALQAADLASLRDCDQSNPKPSSGRGETMKKTVHGGLVAVAAVSMAMLTACGGNHGSGSSAGGATNAAGETTLSWTMWSGGTAERDAWQSAADAVHAANPTITVKLQTTSFDNYFTKIGTQIASGSAPCIISAQSLRLGSLLNGLVPLDSMISTDKLDTSDFVPAALKGLQADGHQYALPYDNGPMLMLYNKDLFTKAGAPLPQNGWTVSDFNSAAKALTKGGKYGMSAYPSDLVMFSQVLSATGVQPVGTDGKLQLTDPSLEQGVQNYAALVSKDKVAPVLAGTDSSTPYNQFIAGTTAMVADGPWDLLSLKSQAKFTLGAVTMPAGTGGTKTLSAGSGFGISTKCPDKEAAFKAISTLTGKDVLTTLAGAGRAFPARISAQQAWFTQAFPGAKQALEAAGASAEPFRTTSNWAQVSTDLIQYGVPAFNGSASTTSVLDRLQSKYGH